MAEAVCEACGSRGPARTEFCRTCGAYLGWDGAVRVLSDAELAAEDRRRRQSATAPGRSAGDAAPVGGPADTGLPPPCQVCGTRAEVGRTFCRRCGHPLTARSLPERSGPATVPWWRRWRSREAEQARAARAAYRRSLPVRYRLTRALLGLAVAAAAVGAVTVADQNPVGRVRSAAADLRGATSAVEVRTISTAPADRELPGHPAGHAVDRFADSWWATSFRKAGARLGTTCDVAGDRAPTGVLVVELDRATVLRQLWITSGPPEQDPDASSWALPTALVVAVDRGRCRRLSLEPDRDPQALELRVTTKRLTVAVVAVAPQDEPATGPRSGIAGLELRARGG